MGRSTFTLAAFLIAVGVLFTLMAPGGLGEPTIGLGVLFALSALLPEQWVRHLATRGARVTATALLALGAVLTIVDWRLGLGHGWDATAVVLFFGGFLVLVLHVVVGWRLRETAPRPRAADARR